MLVVSKFGGSSLSCAEQFKKVKNIVLSNEKRKIIVVSALGKRFNDDVKITDLLYNIHDNLEKNLDTLELWKIFEARYLEVEKELKLNCNIKLELDKIKNELSSKISVDYLVSRGEYLTAKLMSNYLSYEFIDAKELIKFNDSLSVDEAFTTASFKKLKYKKGIVVPGFYASTHDDKIKLFSRGGSDISGSILAACIKAEVYENFTDVSGVMTADPRIIDNPKIIKTLTYNELRQLSYMGASVLHEETIFYVQKNDIPIHLLNTNKPNDKGTIISNSSTDRSVIRGIAGKKSNTAFTIFNKNLSSSVGYLRKVLSIFEKNHVNIDHAPTGIDDISIFVKEEHVKDIKDVIVKELNKELKPDKITISEPLALIAIVGSKTNFFTKLSSSIFSALANNDIEIKTINLGLEELNIIIGIPNNQFELTYKILYEILNDKM